VPSLDSFFDVAREIVIENRRGASGIQFRDHI
jgi:hypothetical protein